MKRWKRYVPLVLVLFVLGIQMSGAASAVELADEDHTCVFATGWSNDENHHWHACTAMSGCEQKMGMAVHAWNNGELTQASTEQATGTITYTCTVCEASKTEAVAVDTTVVTRADLEVAVAEVAWDYYFKKEKLQYCSQELDVMGKYYGGHYRLTEGAAPEYGTSHTTINAVCSDYVWKTYNEALNYQLFGMGNQDAVTAAMWLFSKNQPGDATGPEPVDEDDVNVALVRWAGSAYQWETEWGLSAADCMDEETIQSFFENWETNLRPGDAIELKGHVMLYVGNGMVLHCSGRKYNVTTGTDNYEYGGGVGGAGIIPIEAYIDETSGFYYKNYAGDGGRLVVFRPSYLLVAEGYDDDPGNDIVDYEIPADTLSRQDYPAMDIDRTVNITPYGNAVEGEELTYTVKITNWTNDANYKEYRGGSYTGETYTDLVVTETIPAGTEFVENSIVGGGSYDASAGKLAWTVSVAAGETVTLSYKVKVMVNTGETITSSSGYVANIPSNSISNLVGGTKLTEDEDVTTALSSIANSSVADWSNVYGTGSAFVNNIYEAMGMELDLPTVENIVANMFEWQNVERKSLSIRYEDESDVHVFMLKDAFNDTCRRVRGMMIPGFWGGYRFYTGAEARQTTVNEFRVDYMEPGDILVWVESNDSGVVTGHRVMVCTADGKLLSMSSNGTGAVYSGNDVKSELWKTFKQSNALFFALRPTQIDLYQKHNWDEGTTTEPNCTINGFTVYICQGCETCVGETRATRTVSIPALGHDWNESVTNRDDAFHIRSCGRTGCNHTEDVAHTWDNGMGGVDQIIYTCTATDCGATKTEVRGYLTDAQIQVLQSLKHTDMENVQSDNNMGFPAKYADKIYAKLGIQNFAATYTYYDSGKGYNREAITAANAVNLMFVKADGAAASGYGDDARRYNLGAESMTTARRMLVDSYYGGRWILDGDGNRMAGENAPINLGFAQLQIGDVVVLGRAAGSGDQLLWFAVYQGNGAFIASAAYNGTFNISAGGQLWRAKIIFGSDGDLIESEFVKGTAGTNTAATLRIDSYAEFLTIDPLCGEAWDYFFVLRPGKVLDNSGLTEIQIAELQKLTYTSTATTNSYPGDYVNKVYAAMGIAEFEDAYRYYDAATLRTAKTTAQTVNLMFTNRNPIPSTYTLDARVYDLKPTSGDTTLAREMLIDGYYGGEWVLDSSDNRMSDAALNLAIDDLLPGDVIVLGKADSSSQRILWFAVYQGNGAFINSAYYQGYGAYSGGIDLRAKLVFGTGVSCEIATGTTGTTGTSVSPQVNSYTEFLTRDPLCGEAWDYFFALRPGVVLNNNLAS